MYIETVFKCNPEEWVFILYADTYIRKGQGSFFVIVVQNEKKIFGTH